MYGIEVSKLNPIGLMTPEDLNFYSDCFWMECYAQKYNSGDITNLQILTDETHPLTAMYFVDKRGLIAKDIPFSVDTKTVDGVSIWTALVNFSTVPKGEYVIRADFGDKRLFSHKIDIGQHDCTVLINYSNDENTQSVIFTTGAQFYIRVEGGFIPPAMLAESHETMYVDQKVNHTIIRSTPYVTWTITFGGQFGIPDWLGEILNCVMGCNMLFIDDKQYSKYESAKWDYTQFEGRDLRAWSIRLIEHDQHVYDLGICSGEFIDFIEQQEITIVDVMGANRSQGISFGGNNLIKLNNGAV